MRACPTRRQPLQENSIGGRFGPWPRIDLRTASSETSTSAERPLTTSVIVRDSPTTSSRGSWSVDGSVRASARSISGPAPVPSLSDSQLAGLVATGLDIAPELLDVARKTATERGLSAHFVEGRAEDTGQVAESFDLVSAGECWWWFNEHDAIREIRRILALGGRLIICSFSYLPLSGNVANRTEELVLRHNPGWPKAGWDGIHPEHVRALDRGGFTGVESFSYLSISRSATKRGTAGSAPATVLVLL